ncbi:uncharacterized protein LOC126266174 [Aethina tumida]|uniref:uncharacterized protein LOC126266174 n=1 Tax=Aethina tumida TaxID=116153 RepID=UPI002148EA50|nr:uncharacterized protein LOC126266174 [Aethina tumida]
MHFIRSTFFILFLNFIRCFSEKCQFEFFTPDNTAYNFIRNHGTELYFKVHASNDAHIGLFSVPHMKNPWYEIVIGGWANSKSVIRKNKQDEHGFIVMSSNTRNILDPTRFIGFSVRFHNRTIDVTREDEEKPFITWSDTVNIANISYIGIHTGFGSTGNWIITKSTKNRCKISINLDGCDCTSNVCVNEE